MNRPRYFEFFVLIASSVLVWWRFVVSDLKLALNSDAHTYILLILPLSLGLIFLGKRELHSVVRPGWRSGAVIVGVALVLRLLIGWNVLHLSASGNLSLSIAILVGFWIGSVILCFGIPTLKTYLFALGLLFLLVPMPEHVVSWVTEFLQQKSAVASTLLFRAVGVPVTRDDIMLSIPGLDIEVATECSSIRSSTILIVVTMILGQLFLRTWWRKTLLVLAAMVLAVAKNAVRIVTIAELGSRVDPGYLDGDLHHQGGIIFFALAVLGVVALLWLLRKNESTLRESTPAAVHDGSA